MARSGPEPIPVWVQGRTLVVCVEGPNHGGWYFLDHGSGSWMERRRLALADGEGPGGRTLGYARTDGTLPHPRWDGVEGRVLIWNGGSD